MKKMYVCAPYTADTDNERYHNIQHARKMAEYWWKQRWAVYCPHLNSAWMSGLVDEEYFYRGTIEFLKVCDAIAVAWNRETSLGCGKEIALAKARGITRFDEVTPYDDSEMDFTRIIKL